MFPLECTNLEQLLPFQIERASACAGAPSISTTVSGVTSNSASFPSCSSCSPCPSSSLCSPRPLRGSSFSCSSSPCPAARRRLGAQRAERPGQVPHSRLPGVAADDGLDRVIVDLDLIGRQPVARELQRQQATGRDDRLLRLGVHPRQPGASPRPYWLGTSPYRVRARFRPLPAEDSPLLGLGSFLVCRGPAGFPAGELTLIGFRGRLRSSVSRTCALFPRLPGGLPMILSVPCLPEPLAKIGNRPGFLCRKPQGEGRSVGGT